MKKQLWSIMAESHYILQYIDTFINTFIWNYIPKNRILISCCSLIEEVVKVCTDEEKDD